MNLFEDKDRLSSMIISNGAAEYLEAAKKLMVDPVSAPHPFWFCAFQSIELSLKAFLRGKGFSKEQLKSRDLGHKLDVLYKESVANALADHVTLTVAEESVVCEVGAMYCQKVFQYTDDGITVFPSRGCGSISALQRGEVLECGHKRPGGWR